MASYLPTKSINLLQLTESSMCKLCILCCILYLIHVILLIFHTLKQIFYFPHFITFHELPVSILSKMLILFYFTIFLMTQRCFTAGVKKKKNILKIEVTPNFFHQNFVHFFTRDCTLGFSPHF